jgi:hypothetical protein
MPQPLPGSLKLRDFSTTYSRLSELRGISPEMEWRKIRFANGAADHDRFHRAAADLRLKPSTLSRHLREMAAGAQA